MITYNDYDLAWYSGYCDIVEYLGGSEPSEDEIWEIARESSEVPNFENILYDIILTRITQITEDRYGYKCNFYINSRDTHLYVEKDKISSLEDYISKIDELDEIDNDTN